MSNIKFIPYTFVNSKQTYFDMRPVMSFGTRTVAIIGARRIGKTYSAKRYATKRFMYEAKQMVWLRDNDSAREKLASDKGSKFFSDYLPRTSANAIGSIEGDTILLDCQTMGYLMPASTFQNYKGNAYENVETVIYDEFIPEHGKVLKGSPTWEFINTMYTILSTRRNARVILLANALDRGDAVLDLFGFNVKDYGIYVNREKDVALHYCDNSPEFIKERDNSIVGKWIRGTAYEDNLFHNKFADDTEQFFDRRPSKCSLICVIQSGVGRARIYLSAGRLYVSEDLNAGLKSVKTFVSDYREITTSTRLISTPQLNAFMNTYARGDMLFENARVKNIFLDFVKK